MLKNGIKFEWKLGLFDEDESIQKKTDRSSLQGNNLDSTSKKRKIFFQSYKNKFEKFLNVSLEHLSNRKNDTLWRIFETYGYATHELNLNSKQKILEFFEKPYLLNFGGGNYSEKEKIFQIPEQFQSTVFFKTVMYQNVSEQQKLKITSLYGNLSEVLATLIVTFEIIYKISNLDSRTLEKKISSDFQSELNKQIENLPKKFDDAEEKAENIFVTEEDVFEKIFCRMTWLEFKNFRDVIKNSFIVAPKHDFYYEQVILFREIDFSEKISTNTWLEFKEKYKLYLEKFFPEITDVHKLEEYWRTTVNLLIYSPFEIPKDVKKLLDKFGN